MELDVGSTSNLLEVQVWVRVQWPSKEGHSRMQKATATESISGIYIS